MTIAKKSCCHKHSSAAARIVDGSLVLSFPDAAEPVVWRMDLAQAKEAGFEIKEARGKFKLIQKSGNETQDIASFDDRERAVAALMDVSNALQGGTHSPKAANDTGRAAGNEAVQWLIAIAGVLIVIGLFMYLSRIAPVDSGPAAPQSQASSVDGADGDTNGVPLSADEFLRGQ